jgi:hypothetical protein
MLAQNLRYGLSSLALAAFASATSVACTFPTVDYDDSLPDGGQLCSSTGRCATDARKCGEKALSEHSDCVNGCNEKGGATCISDCDAQRNGALGTCTTACQNCEQAQQGQQN